jgi:hypothetical protein
MMPAHKNRVQQAMMKSSSDFVLKKAMHFVFAVSVFATQFDFSVEGERPKEHIAACTFPSGFGRDKGYPKFAEYIKSRSLPVQRRIGAGEAEDKYRTLAP